MALHKDERDAIIGTVVRIEPAMSSGGGASNNKRKKKRSSARKSKKSLKKETTTARRSAKEEKAVEHVDSSSTDHSSESFSSSDESTTRHEPLVLSDERALSVGILAYLKFHKFKKTFKKFQKQLKKRYSTGKDELVFDTDFVVSEEESVDDCMNTKLAKEIITFLENQKFKKSARTFKDELLERLEHDNKPLTVVDVEEERRKRRREVMKKSPPPSLSLIKKSTAKC